MYRDLPTVVAVAGTCSAVRCILFSFFFLSATLNSRLLFCLPVAGPGAGTALARRRAEWKAKKKREKKAGTKGEKKEEEEKKKKPRRQLSHAASVPQLKLGTGSRRIRAPPVDVQSAVGRRHTRDIHSLSLSGRPSRPGHVRRIKTSGLFNDYLIVALDCSADGVCVCVAQ